MPGKQGDSGSGGSGSVGSGSVGDSAPGPSAAFRPVSADALPELLADLLDAAPVPGHALRVAIDGPPCAQPGRLAAQLVGPLRARGRDAAPIAAETFWRDASLRLEYGRHDVESYLSWLDADALRREVLDPAGPGGSGQYLVSLRDPVSNRATRQPRRAATPGTVLLVHGGLLLGRGLPFDRSLHLAMTPAARARRTDVEQAWTLAAYDYDDARTRPAQVADIVLRLDDPRHPAMAVGPAPERPR